MQNTNEYVVRLIIADTVPVRHWIVPNYDAAIELCEDMDVEMEKSPIPENMYSTEAILLSYFIELKGELEHNG